MKREDRYKAALSYFQQQMPQVATELHYGSTFQLLVAVILSAQCTDKRINQVTPSLFGRFPDAQTMAAAEPYEVYEYIKSVSYPNAKSQHLVLMARSLMEHYLGQVPQDMSQLMKLPGVGRKTANVVQAVAFGRNALAVDTHVYRVSHRLGLVASTDNTPLKVEQRLMRHIPADQVPLAHHWLLLHGRYVCTSLRPKCSECGMAGFCPKLLKGSKLNSNVR